MDGNDASSPRFASTILAHLYALGAARICEDPEAVSIIRESIRDEEEAFLPAAAVAVAYSCVQASQRSDDPFSDERIGALHPLMTAAIAAVLHGAAADIFILEDGEDPVEVAAETVASFWNWSAEWDTEEALRIARRHCANMAVYRSHDPDREDPSGNAD